MNRLRKSAETLGHFNEQELNKIQEIIDYLDSKKNMLTGFANRSSNIEDGFIELYKATEILKQGLEIERKDNIY